VNFEIKIHNVQHVKKLIFNADLSKNQLFCIVGKNSIGKTTFIRAIENLKSADIFTKTASPYIFNQDSCIIYTINETEYIFKFNPKLNVIDTNAIIDEQIKNSIYVELPIPHGERFNHFRKLSEIDDELRKNISLQLYAIPEEIIQFLSKVYNSNRFEDLKETTIKGVKYYFILKNDGFYIREDYLSSGEYFVITLYKLIQHRCKIIVIDEIDISLDASAQVNLLRELRQFCNEYEVNIIFTTHSLALMKTLYDYELFYMDSINSEVSIDNKSYNYVKSILFGFKGWDKYILTEDQILEQYLLYLLSENNESYFFKYKIIYIGGGTNVIDLMNRNNKDQFFSLPKNVISVLDGDQRNEEYCKNNNRILFTPFQSVEKQLKEYYEQYQEEIPRINSSDTPRALFNCIIQTKIMTEQGIFCYINGKKRDEVNNFKQELIKFLSINS